MKTFFVNRLGRIVLVLVGLTILCGSLATAQVLKGSISGTVVDPQGAVVAGAQVKALHKDTGSIITATTEASGLFRFNLVPIGTYRIEIAAKGFKTAFQEDVHVSAGVDSGLGSIPLSVGQTDTTVEVNGGTQLIETTQAQISNTFEGQTLHSFAGIQENEGLDRLALFIPGVANTRDLNQFSNRNGVGFSNDGLRGRFNDQEIDGQNNNDNSIGGPALFVTDPNFVQQYVVISNNFSPEYGRNAGSVVNVITPSGTNTWHGSLYGDENNSFLNALSSFQKAAKNLNGTNRFTGPPRSNIEFSGGTIGGPIVKNKAFLFSGFDDQINSSSNVFSSNLLTPTPTGLSQLTACPGVDANALSALRTFGPYSISAGNPVPVATLNNGTTFATKTIAGCPGIQFGGVSRLLPTPAHAFNWIEKADLQLGQDSFMGRYIFNRNNVFNRQDNGAAGWVFNQSALSQAVLLGWTHNFGSHMVNELKAGYDRLNVQFGGNTIGNTLEPTTANQLGALADIIIPGNLGFGPNAGIPQGRFVNTWQAQENWNLVLGKHTLKAGANWTYQQSPNIFLPEVNGVFVFGSWNSYLTNHPAFDQIIQGPNTGFKEYDTFLYAGDDWKIGQNLTLNLGLTWAYYGNPSSIFSQLSTQRETNPATAIWLSTLPLSARTVPSVNNVYSSFGPGIGFAYSPQWGGFLTGRGKTVIRGGYRLSYDPPFYNIFSNVGTAPPYVNFPTAALPLPAVPTGANVRAEFAPLLVPGTANPLEQGGFFLPKNFGPDMVHSWSLGIEREVTRNSAFEVRYVGNHGGHLYQTINANPFIADLKAAFPNLVPAGLTPCPTAQAIDPISVGRVNCSLGTVQEDTNSGFSNYHALQTQFRANNMFKQLTMITNYTWSRTLDNATDVFATSNDIGNPGAGVTNPLSQNPVAPGGAEYSISGLNVPHVWTLEFVEQLPFFKEQHGALGRLLGGWSFSGTYILASGQVYTPFQIGSEAINSAGGDFFDANFLANEGFNGDIARPFLGSLSAPSNSVGIFAGDCPLLGFSCGGNPTQLVSLNALNSSGGTQVVNVSNSQVRYILNAGTAESVFGTPFGTAARNLNTDAMQNIANFSVFKNIKLSERTAFQMHITLNNAFNHFNFNSIDPLIEDAGKTPRNGVGFGVPAAANAAGRTIFVGGTITF
jgi:hypothetical protein